MKSIIIPFFYKGKHEEKNQTTLIQGVLQSVFLYLE